MKTVCTVLAIAGALMIVNSAGAAAKKKDKDGISYFQAVDRYLNPVTLTDDQKSKLDDLKKEYEPRLKEVYAKLDVLTADQKKAGDEAKKAAQAAGKKGQDVKDAVAKAINKTSGQMQQENEARKKRTAVENDMHKRIVALLTDEQKAQIAAARVKKSEKPAKPAKVEAAPATPATPAVPATPATK